MGQAKRRGTFEQRLAQALERQAQEAKVEAQHQEQRTAIATRYKRRDPKLLSAMLIGAAIAAYNPR